MDRGPRLVSCAPTAAILRDPTPASSPTSSQHTSEILAPCLSPALRACPENSSPIQLPSNGSFEPGFSISKFVFWPGATEISVILEIFWPKLFLKFWLNLNKIRSNSQKIAKNENFRRDVSLSVGGEITEISNPGSYISVSKYKIFEGVGSKNHNIFYDTTCIDGSKCVCFSWNCLCTRHHLIEVAKRRRWPLLCMCIISMHVPGEREMLFSSWNNVRLHVQY